MNKKLYDALITIDSNVRYGTGRFVGTSNWNQIIFGRAKIEKSGTNGLNFKETYWVSVVREDFIDDDLPYSVVLAVENSIPGIRMDSTQPMSYGYIQKGETDSVVEVVKIYFVKIKAGC